MRLFIKQLLRSPIRLISFSLLLILAGSVFLVGLNAFNSISIQREEMVGLYTSICVPNYKYLESDEETLKESEEGLLPYFSFSIIDENRQERHGYVDEALEIIAESEYCVSVEDRHFIAAGVADCKPIFCYEDDYIFTSNYGFFSSSELNIPNNLVLLVVNCNEVIDFSYDTDIYEKADNDKGYILYEGRAIFYDLELEIEEIIYANEELQMEAGKKLFSIFAQFVDENDSIPFEKGKSYVIWGQVNEEASKGDEVISEPFSEIRFGATYDVLSREISYGQVDYYYEKDGIKHLAKKTLDEYPMFAELPEGMTFDEFLETEENIAWRDTIVPMIETSIQTVPVVTTNDLYSIVMFNNFTTPVFMGREFTEEEYEQGSKVCIVSANYAEHNELEVGDTLSLKLYNSGWNSSNVGATYVTPNYYCPLVHPMLEEEEYEIVGIYKDRGLAFGTQDFSPNTIFIPEASVSDPALLEVDTFREDLEYLSSITIYFDIPFDYHRNTPEKLKSIIIENGSVDEIQSLLTEKGYTDVPVRFYDQGYDEMAEESAIAMQANAKKMMYFGAGLFVFATLLFVFLYNLWLKRIGSTMRMLGTARGKVYFGAVASTVLIAIVAFAIGAVISYFAYDKICAALLSDSMELGFSIELSSIVFGCEVIFIILCSVIFPSRLLTKRPIRLVKD